MRKEALFLYILALLVTGVFVYGIVYLLILRYETGDIYPPYSSLRTDPLGAKAFYEGIDNIQGLTSYRNYQPIVKLRDVRDTTIFYVGMAPLSFLSAGKEAVKTFEELVLNGNRLIISFSPVYRRSSLFPLSEEEEAEEEEEEGKEEKKNGQADNGYFEKPVSLTERWGVEFGYTELPVNEDNVRESIQALSQGDVALPAPVSWHTSLYFNPSDKGRWKVIYVADGHPVIIEKNLGKGTVVLSADSYFLSNEAMRNERHPELLAWLIGSNPEVVFDETHLGVMETPGIASLIRKYRLGWFIAGLVVLAVLFVWKNAFSFVPPHKEPLTEGGEPGKDITAGLINLLRQNISSRDILSICFDEWKKSFTHREKELGNTFEEIRSVIHTENARPTRERNPVECYKTISKFFERFL